MPTRLIRTTTTSPQSDRPVKLAGTIAQLPEDPSFGEPIIPACEYSFVAQQSGSSLNLADPKRSPRGRSSTGRPYTGTPAARAIRRARHHTPRPTSGSGGSHDACGSASRSARSGESTPSAASASSSPQTVPRAMPAAL